MNEKKYYYETYKEYLEENEIKPSKTLVVTMNESAGDVKLVLTEFGHVANEIFDESMKRVEETPKKRGGRRGTVRGHRLSSILLWLSENGGRLRKILLIAKDKKVIKHRLKLNLW